jgi:hypothetical protein
VRAIVDTNVLIAANQRNTHATMAVAARAATVLLDIQQGKHLILQDTAGLILKEYQRYCSFSGQPGAADRFFLWFFRSQHVMSAVERVDIGTESTLIEHLPDYLHGFDKSDHKWVAVYLVGRGDVVYNATDSDWSEHAEGMERAGIYVCELG